MMKSIWIFATVILLAKGIEESDFELLKKEVATLKKELVDLKTAKRSGEVAFTASKLVTQLYEGEEDTVIYFENVITDVGNWYYPQDGEFTAPIPGVYYFNVALQASAGRVACAYLVKNDADIMMSIQATAPQEFSSTANGIVLELIAGDTFKVKFNPGCGNVGVLGSPQAISTFTGYYVSTI